jgi:F-type H+-transporting ATPase subunit delta
MTAVSSKNIAQAIYLASKDKKPEEQSLVAKKTLQFLIKKRLLSKTKDILSHLKKIINDNEGRLEVKVYSSEKINEKTNRELTQALLKRYSVKEISLVEILDKKLIGGLKIEVRDEIIDLTLRNRIKKLQEHLTSNI